MMALHTKKASVPAPTDGVLRENKPNEYYLGVSARYMRAKFIVLVLFAVYLVFMLARYRDDITYENMMYLLRDFSVGDSEYSTVFEPVRYDEQDNMTYALFRGELVVAGNRTVSAYNSSGTLSRRYETAYSDPLLLSSDKYLIACDLGSAEYSVYNSITRVSGGEAPGTIEGADVNDRGDHLLVCRSDETKYVVYVYNSSFKNTAKYYKNKYVICAAVGKKSRDTVICSVELASGNVSCEIEFYKEGADSPTASYTESGVFPLKCGTWKDGAFYAVCTDRILFFDKNGALVKSVAATGYGYSSVSADESTLTVSADNDALGEKSSIFVFDTTGELLYNVVVDGSVCSVSSFGGVLYALAGGSAYRIPYSGDGAGHIDTVDVPEDSDVILADGVSAVICAKNTAFGFSEAENDAVSDDE